MVTIGSGSQPEPGADRVPLQYLRLWLNKPMAEFGLYARAGDA